MQKEQECSIFFNMLSSAVLHFKKIYIYIMLPMMAFRIKDLIYSIQSLQRTKELESPDLLRQLPALQQLLSRLLDCQVMYPILSFISIPSSVLVYQF